MNNILRFPAIKGWAAFLAGVYLSGSFLSNGLHLHADLFHAHDERSQHHLHIVLHSHSDLTAQLPACAEIESQESEHHHPLGECQRAAFSQALNKRSRPSESKKEGSGTFVNAFSPQLFFSKPLAVFLPFDDLPPEKMVRFAFSGRSPPSA